MKLSFFILSFFCCYFFSSAQAQTPAATDTLHRVDILSAKKLEYRRVDSTAEYQILVGGVRLKQGTTLFDCDSCVINQTSKVFEAFGHVHIIDNDTINIYSSYLRYLTNKKLAHLTGNVKLTDGHGVLTTPQLDYDVNTKIGTYNNGGKVVSKKSVLTSKEGVYYGDLRDVYFKQNVVLKDPAIYLKTDSLLYNTESQIARFITDTYIRDSSKRIIRTSEGYYDTRAGHSEFTKRTSIEDKSLRVIGDEIANDDSAGVAQIRGHGVVMDTAQGLTILANDIFINKRTNAFLATQKPLMIIRQEKDSIYITGDTLFTARLTDLYKQSRVPLPKTPKLKKGVTEDSTNRYFEAFRHVRIFSDSVQAVSDSLFYSFKDSTFRLFQSPIVWSHGSQIVGDTIFLYTKNKKADKIKVFENSFMVSQVEPGVYNQIKATRMDGYFKEGVMDSIRAKGAAESIYFIRNADSTYSGTNQSQSDIMDIYFADGDLSKIVLRSDVKGTYAPITKESPGKMRLPNFKWYESRRPKTKYELFE